MINYGTKVNNQPNSADGTLTAEEFNALATELKNTVLSSGRTLSSSNAFQLAESLAIYTTSGAYYLDSGSANVYTLTLPGSRVSVPVYVDGMRIRFYAANSNTDACTVNVAGIGTKDIKLPDGTPLVAGNIQAGANIELVYRTSLGYFILSQYINVTGAQTIFDKKTFNTTPSASTDPVGGTDLVRKSYMDSTISALPVGNYPINYRGSAAPVYASSTSFTSKSIQLRDSTNTSNISKNSTTTVSMGSIGLNGIAQSNNLTGTVSVSNGSPNITFSTSQTGVVQAGDVIVTAGGNARRVSSGSGTSYVAESNWSATEPAVTCKRGGLAKNTDYYLYGIAKAAGALPGYIWSTRNVSLGDTMVDLPTDYLYFAQEGLALKTTSGSVTMPWKIATGWPHRPKIVLDVDVDTSPFKVVDASILNSWTSIDLSVCIPAGAVTADFTAYGVHNSLAGYNFAKLRPGGSSSTTGRIILFTGAPNNSQTAQACEVPDMAISSSRTVEFIAAGSNGPQLTLGVYGYTMEVN